jgi:lipopolysaccharide export system permease protein
MSILSRYIATSLVRGWALVLLVLATVFGLIGFIQELEHTRFGYDAAAVARYSLLILPQQLMSLAPVIVLLGSIVALANLDKFNELTIVCCSGVPLRQLIIATAIPTMVLMGLLWLGMEYVTAPLHQLAEKQRHALRYRNDVRIPDGGLWSRHGQRYVHLGKMLEGGIPGDISLYEFTEQGELLLAIKAQSAAVSPDRRWLFKQVRIKELVNGELTSRSIKELEISNLWAPEELPTLTLSSDSMTLSVLYSYSQYLLSHQQSASRYLAAFWQQLTMPLTAAAMVLLATPVSANLGSRRERNFGGNMAIGALIGILFYLGAQIIFALGQLLDVSVVLIAISPAIIVFACALFLLNRMRW